jgi:hypothetical protein
MTGTLTLRTTGRKAADRDLAVLATIGLRNSRRRPEREHAVRQLAALVTLLHKSREYHIAEVARLRERLQRAEVDALRNRNMLFKAEAECARVQQELLGERNLCDIRFRQFTQEVEARQEAEHMGFAIAELTLVFKVVVGYTTRQHDYLLTGLAANIDIVVDLKRQQVKMVNKITGRKAEAPLAYSRLTAQAFTAFEAMFDVTLTPENVPARLLKELFTKSDPSPADMPPKNIPRNMHVRTVQIGDEYVPDAPDYNERLGEVALRGSGIHRPEMQISTLAWPRDNK